MIGVLVLTSMQEDSFAPDALEALNFTATLVTRFVADYRRCFEETDEHLVDEGSIASADESEDRN